MSSQPAPGVAPPPLLSRSSWLDLSVVAGGGLGAGLVFAVFYALQGNLRLAFVGGIVFGSTKTLGWLAPLSSAGQPISMSQNGFDCGTHAVGDPAGTPPGRLTC